jgi:DnaA family protein
MFEEKNTTPWIGQLPLSIQLNQEATFANFCWTGNQLLYTQLNALLAHDGDKMLYLWGASGSGKTHLAQACCHAFSEGTSSYIPLSIFKSWDAVILEGMDERGLIVLDDVQAIAGDKAWEEAVFHLYNRVKDNASDIMMIMTGNTPPALSSIGLPDLKSRLGWGLVVQVNELPDDDKINTLRQQALTRGFELPLSVAQFLIRRSARNMHDLQRLLDLLDKASLAAQRKITVPFVKSILGI